MPSNESPPNPDQQILKGILAFFLALVVNVVLFVCGYYSPYFLIVMFVAPVTVCQGIANHGVESGRQREDEFATRRQAERQQGRQNDGSSSIEDDPIAKARAILAKASANKKPKGGEYSQVQVEDESQEQFDDENQEARLEEGMNSFDILQSPETKKDDVDSSNSNDNECISAKGLDVV